MLSNRLMLSLSVLCLFATTCQADNCTVPEITNGEITGDKSCVSGGVVDVNVSCSISCYTGYTTESTEPLKCNSQDIWSSNWDNCTRFPFISKNEKRKDTVKNFWESCTVPPVNGGVSMNCTEGAMVDAGTACNITCYRGYYLSSTIAPTCTGQNNWIGDWNVCKAYMLPVNDTRNYVAVKYGNVTLQVKVKSDTDQVTISVFLTSSPRTESLPITLNMVSNIRRSLVFETTILNLTESDSGTYEFEVQSSSEDQSLYPNITDNVKQSVSIEVIPENFKFEPPGSEYTYVMGVGPNHSSCSVNAVPPATITWKASTGNSTQFDNCDGSVFSDGNILSLNEAYFSDNGSFTCMATNDASERTGQSPSMSIVVKIEGIPINTKATEVFTPRDNVTLICNMDANPEPINVDWSRDGEEYDDSSNVFVQQSEISSSDATFYYKYENSLFLTSQLCMGEFTISCSPSSTHGPSQNPTTYVINSGNYDLHGENYFIFPDGKVDFSSAMEDCQDSGGHLVYIQDNVTQEYLNDKFDYHKGSFYIGAVRDPGGVWRWGQNGTEISYFNWNGTDEPGSGNCSVSTPDGWVATSCDSTHNYVCEAGASGIPNDLTLNVGRCVGTYFNITWKPADSLFATTESRVIITNENASSIFKNVTLSETEYIVNDAAPNTAYTVEVFAGVDRCTKFYPSSKTNATTGYDVPEMVTDALLNSEESESLICKISWKYNEVLQWQISSFEVSVKINLLYGTGEAGDSPICDPGVQTSCTFEMSPNSIYTANIRAVSCAGTGEEVNAGGACTSPPAAPAQPLAMDDSSQTGRNFNADDGIAVVIPIQNQRNGPISCIFVIITVDDTEAASKSRSKAAINTTDNFNAVNNETNGQYFAYVTNETSAEETFVIGGGGVQSSVCNPNPVVSQMARASQARSYQATNYKLNQSKYYRYYFISTTPTGSSFLIQSSTISAIYISNSPIQLWLVGVVVGTMILITCGAIGYFYFRRKKKPTSDDDGFYENAIDINEQQSTSNLYETIDNISSVRHYDIALGSSNENYEIVGQQTTSP